jgi:hypothetical protein
MGFNSSNLAISSWMIAGVAIHHKSGRKQKKKQQVTLISL